MKKLISLSTGSLVTPGNSSFVSSNVLKYRLPQGINLNGTESIWLHDISLAYSWRNISAKLNNNYFEYIFNGQTRRIDLPDSFLDFKNMKGVLELNMLQNGDYVLDSTNSPEFFIDFVSNITSYGLTITLKLIYSTLPANYSNPRNISLSGQTPQLVIPDTNIKSYFGFDTALTLPNSPQTVPQYFNSTSPANESSITSVVVACNLVNSQAYSLFPNMLYSFVPNVAYGNQLNIVPVNLIQLPCAMGSFQTVDISFYSQDLQPLQIVDKAGVLVNLLIDS